MTKKTRKIITSIAIALPLILSGCGGSDSSSDDSSSEDSSATLTASDIDVSVSCGEWRSTITGNGEADCDISIKNNSAASGTIYLLWDWKDGDKSCGVGASKGTDGQPGDISIDANESGTLSTVQGMMCAPGYFNPVAENISVTVRD